MKLVIAKDRFVAVKNAFGEHSWDYLSKNTYVFEKGKIYGIICEHGGGGEAVSQLISNQVKLNNEKFFLDNVEEKNIDIGWYVGQAVYLNDIVKVEMSIRKSLEKAMRKHNIYRNMDEIINEFHLTREKMDYKYSRNCEWEKWRASLALGCVNEKEIFCFPWMNSLEFYDCMYNSSVFRFFKRFKQEGKIIILPTSREENVYNLADEIIHIECPRFEHVLSESEYFKNNF